MRKISLVLLLAFFVTGTFASNSGWVNLLNGKNPETPEVVDLNNVLTKAEKKEGWKLLWDGKTLDGWVSYKDGTTAQKGWTIQNDELITDLPGNTGGGDIVTKKEFKNFVLEVDFLFTPGANSGIKYFIQPAKDGKGFSNVGFEYQVLDNDKHPDAKAGINGNRKLSSLYDLIPANWQKLDPAQSVNPSKGVSQWNRARIVVEGNKVTHYLNGIKVVEIVRGTLEWKAAFATSKFKDYPGFGEFATGHILLQDHGNEVHYRNIKIKELK